MMLDNHHIFTRLDRCHLPPNSKVCEDDGNWQWQNFLQENTPGKACKTSLQTFELYNVNLRGILDYLWISEGREPNTAVWCVCEDIITLDSWWQLHYAPQHKLAVSTAQLEKTCFLCQILCWTLEQCHGVPWSREAKFQVSDNIQG